MKNDSDLERMHAVGGRSTFGGQAQAQRARDLGDLARAPLSWRLRNLLQHRRRSLVGVATTQFLGRMTGALIMQPSLSAVHFRASAAALGLTPWEWTRIQELSRQNVPFETIAQTVSGTDRWLWLQQLLRANASVVELTGAFGGHAVDYGRISTRKVTTTGVGFFVDAWQNLLEMEIMKYHGVGTGAVAESSGDTALGTESTTILNPDSTRATGSLTEGASANIFRTVGTVTFDGSGAITEHGILSTAATGGGVLWDRSVFSAINVVSADTIQFTYDLTASAEA